ncbi:DUF3995 domain-containing protein [Kitasatospora sp. NPDC002040]|uniref:DUF3995 domain-containing protein n=1 Tax=Kitasatospora sp. NPDC002040 TaxID=3154661 RepID=UPI003322691A
MTGTTDVRAAAGLAATGLIGAGVLHGVWLRSPWPLETPAELARVVVGPAGPDGGLPPKAATAVVAGLLGAAGGLVLAGARPESRLGRARLVRAGMWTVAGVLAARGAAGPAVSGLRLREETPEFRRLNLRLYSPLCLGLAGLTGHVVLRTRRRA